MNRLDRYDLNILAELQRDATLSNQDLAERIGLSPSPCSRRVKQLQDDVTPLPWRLVERRIRDSFELGPDDLPASRPERVAPDAPVGEVVDRIRELNPKGLILSGGHNGVGLQVQVSAGLCAAHHQGRGNRDSLLISGIQGLPVQQGGLAQFADPVAARGGNGNARRTGGREQVFIAPGAEP